MKERIEAILASGWTVQFLPEMLNWRENGNAVYGPGVIISNQPDTNGHCLMIEDGIDDQNPDETLDDAFDRAYAAWQKYANRDSESEGKE